MIELAELRDAARKAFADPQAAADPERAWSSVVDLGLLMVEVPEDRGGLGLGREAAGAINLELGRVLAPGPALAQQLTIAALSRADRPDLLERAMAGGIMTASLAPGDDCGLLCGVPDAHKASHVLVRQAQWVMLVSLDKAEIVRQPTWDETRRLFQVTLGGEEIYLAEDEAAAALNHALEVQLLFGLAADSLGAAEAALAMSVEYLKTRRQFDRPLAMFQALKHRCADLRTRLSAADALFMSRAADRSTDAVTAGALKAHVDTVACAVTEEAIQLHGGIGLTAEHPCHRFLKRTLLNAALGGEADRLEEAAGRALLEAN